MFKGSIVALITPMDKNGVVDKISMKKLVNYHIMNNTTAIVAVGTTGESSTLTKKEHINVVMSILEFSEGKIPIIAGTGSNSTSEAILLTNYFHGIGISACLSVSPYYNRPNQEGLYQHFKSIAENTNLPQILYNIPKRTGCDIKPILISRLSKINNIIGIKEATGDLSRVSIIKSLVKKDFLLFSGDDATALDFIKLGGDGVISVTANIAAREMSDLCKLILNNNDYTEANKLNKRLIPLYKALFSETNPIPVKWASKKLGLIKDGFLRLPLISLNKKNRLIVKQAMINAGLL